MIRDSRRQAVFGRKISIPFSKRIVSSSSKIDLINYSYNNKTAVLATKHEKLSQIGPPLQSHLGLIVHSVDVDTDSLGTFSGEIPRKGPPLETAIAKARLGIDFAKVPLGIASEGTIGSDHSMPFSGTLDKEIVVLVDDEIGISIWESHASFDITAATAEVRSDEDIESFLIKSDFPRHQLIVRPGKGSFFPIYKGISNRDELREAIYKCALASSNKLAHIETDFRAHVCPSRQKVIGDAAIRLAKRLASKCPECGAPGWGKTEIIYGIPCSCCGTQVPKERAENYSCQVCSFSKIQPILTTPAEADPAECPYCNP